MRIFKITEVNYIKANAANMSRKELAQALNCTPLQIKCLVARYKIKSGRTGYFKKGSVPFNKGTKGLTTANKTSFKKGIVPHNTLQDGAIRPRVDKRGVPYLYIRISKAKWVLYHRYIWEQNHGPIPAKHVVIFIDGNTLNCDAANLKLISMKENVNRNLNRAKAAATMSKLWQRVRMLNNIGLEPSNIKLKLKRKPNQKAVKAIVDAEQLKQAYG